MIVPAAPSRKIILTDATSDAICKMIVLTKSSGKLASSPEFFAENAITAIITARHRSIAQRISRAFAGRGSRKPHNSVIAAVAKTMSPREKNARNRPWPGFV